MDQTLTPPGSRARPVLIAWLLALGALMLALALCEATLGWLGLYTPPPDVPVCLRPDLYQRFDPHGYRLWPSRTVDYTYPRDNPRHLKLISNAQGFRSEREFGEPDARPRILVLGDSMVFGEGVEELERFTNVLERLRPEWRIDNLGMTGYGPDLMLRALEEVGIALRPRVVVLCIYTDDFRRVLPYFAGAGFPVPRFIVRSGQLETIPYPRPRLWTHLRLGMALAHAYWRYSGIEVELNRAILDRFVLHAQTDGFLPAVVFLPGTADTPSDQSHRAWLRTYAEGANLPFLDLTEAIHAAGSQQVFIPGNWHLNPKGHEIVAHALGSFLGNQVLSADAMR